MKSLLHTVRTAALLALILPGARTHGATAADPTSVIIKYKAVTALGKSTTLSSTALNMVTAQFGLGARRPVFTRPVTAALAKTAAASYGLDRIYTLSIGAGTDIDAAVAALNATGELEYAQPNHRYATAAVPNDTHYNLQWALPAVNAPEAWDISTGDATVVIGIIDTGIDYDHEDLRDNIWTNTAELNGTPGIDDDGNGFIDDIRGWDFTDAPGYGGNGDYLTRDNDPDDDNGHGSHAAGIAGARGNNGRGIAGLAWNCRLMAVRAGFSAGTGAGLLEDDDIAAALVYAADNGANVISMSFGDAFLSYVMRDAIRYAYAKGCVLVASAGNSGVAQMAYPARFTETIAVGNVDASGYLSGSNFGENLDVVAPGAGIYSTVPPNTYGYKSGTSMSAPLVAGLAALILSHTPGLAPEEVRGIIRASADDLGATGYDQLYGSGRINALNALRMTEATELAITAPVPAGGHGDSVLIGYEAHGPDLAMHVLEYGADNYPYIWLPVAGPFYHQEFDGSVTWNTAELNEGEYTLRLRATETGGAEREKRIPLLIDRTAPNISAISHGRRLDGGTYTYAVSWETDENTVGQVRFRTTGSPDWMTHTDNYSYVRHAVILGTLAPGNYEFSITATDEAGLTAVSATTPFSIPPYGYIPALPLSRQQVLPAGRALPRATDFDGDGLHEAVIMEYGTSAYGTVRLYERSGDTLAPAAALPVRYDSAGTGRTRSTYVPTAAVDFNDDGRDELVGGMVYAPFYGSFVISSRTPGALPDTVTHMFGNYVRAVTDSASDLDGDNRREAILLTDNNDSLTVYESDGASGFIRTGGARHPDAAGSNWETLLCAGDMDGNGVPVVCAADRNGRVLAVRNITTVPAVTYVDTASFPFGVALLACPGDLDGDGRAELVAAGPVRADYPYDDPDDYWLAVAYEYDGTALRPVWEERCFGVTSGGISSSANGITAADMNGDGTRDLILNIHPGLYVFTADGNGSFTPLFHHRPSEPGGAPFTGTGTLARTILLPEPGGLTLYTLPGGMPYAEFALPFRVWPVDTDRAAVSWHPAGSAVTIYRGTSAATLLPLVTGYAESTFIDSGLTENVPYWYFVTRRDSLLPWLAQRVIPNRRPTLDSATAAAGGRHVTLYFSEPLDPGTVNPGDFAFDGSLVPASALMAAPATVVLGLSSPLPPGSTPTLSYTGFTDTMGTPCAPAAGITVTIPAPDPQPGLDSVRYAGARTVTAYFSMPVFRDSLITHIRFDPYHTIASVSADSVLDSVITVQLPADERIDISRSAYTFYADTVRYSGPGGNMRTATGLSAPVLTGTPYRTLDALVVYPNPYNAEKYTDNRIIFGYVPQHVKIRIYTSSGRLIRTLEETYTDSFVTWGLDNDTGKKVASGLYYYYIESYGPNGTAHSTMGKIAIIR